MFKLDPRLKEWATDRQWEIMEALGAHGSERKAARALGCDPATVHRSKAALLKKAAIHGYAPDHDMVHPVPDGFTAKGVSTLYNLQTGEAKIQWVKSKADDKAREAMAHAAAEALAEELPRQDPITAPGYVVDRLLNNYVITDFHLGALIWGKEAGADWDVKIAEETLRGCFSAMIAAAPQAHTAVICQLGDFLHADSIFPDTPTSQHRLDVDGRFEKVVKAAVRVLRAIVNMALGRHERVVVLMAEGNHDLSSSIWLRALFAALYENEPRVSVDTSPLPYYAHQWGSTALYYHHGHLTKHANLPGVMAAQFPVIWGATKYRYAHCGHLHHRHVKEDHGIVVTQHQTLAPRDSHSARHGYAAERKATAETYHKDHGLVASNYVTPEMLAA